MERIHTRQETTTASENYLQALGSATSDERDPSAGESVFRQKARIGSHSHAFDLKPRGNTGRELRRTPQSSTEGVLLAVVRLATALPGPRRYQLELAKGPGELMTLQLS